MEFPKYLIWFRFERNSGTKNASLEHFFLQYHLVFFFILFEFHMNLNKYVLWVNELAYRISLSIATKRNLQRKNWKNTKKASVKWSWEHRNKIVLITLNNIYCERTNTHQQPKWAFYKRQPSENSSRWWLATI